MANRALSLAYYISAATLAPWLLAFPAWGEGEAAFERALETRAVLEPEAPFRAIEELPPGFRDYLLAEGAIPIGDEWLIAGPVERKFATNREMLRLYRRWTALREQNRAKAFAAGGAPLKMPDASFLEDEKAWTRGALGTPEDLSDLFDGSRDDWPRGVVLISVPFENWRPQLKKAQKDRSGLVLHGIEFGSGKDEPTESREPYLGRGGLYERLMDWDARLRVREESAGFVADYRHPMFLEKVSLSFKQYVDIPREFGVGPLRDTLKGWFGKKPREEREEGYDFSFSAAFDEFWGFGFGHDQKKETGPDGSSWSRNNSLGVGVSPLGRNGGEPWNFAIHGSLAYLEQDIRTPLLSRERSGLGYSGGIAFHHALDSLPLPLINPKGDSKDRWSVFLDRLKVDFGVSDSEIGEMSLRASASVVAYITRHLRVTCEVGCSYQPETGEVDFGPHFGVSLRP